MPFHRAVVASACLAAVLLTWKDLQVATLTRESTAGGQESPEGFARSDVPAADLRHSIRDRCR